MDVKSKAANKSENCKRTVKKSIPTMIDFPKFKKKG